MWANQNRCKGIFLRLLTICLLIREFGHRKTPLEMENVVNASNEVRTFTKVSIFNSDRKTQRNDFWCNVDITHDLTEYQRMSIDCVLLNPLLLFAVYSRRIEHCIDFGVHPPYSYLLQAKTIRTLKNHVHHLIWRWHHFHKHNNSYPNTNLPKPFHFNFVFICLL